MQFSGPILMPFTQFLYRGNSIFAVHVRLILRVFEQEAWLFFMLPLFALLNTVK